MNPSRSYTFDERQAQISLYSTQMQRSHHTLSSEDPSAMSSYFPQQQIHSSAQNASPSTQYLHPAQLPSYSSGISPNHVAQTNHSMATSHSHSGYQSTQPFLNSSQYPIATNQHPINQDIDRRSFIPTPSEMVNGYPSYHGQPGPIPHQRFDSKGESRHPSQHLQSKTKGVSVPSHAPVPVPNSATSSPATPVAERYPCEKCGKTFSRSHDRKRHYETQHHPVPVIHRCRFCEKEFSRADSLKRHLDNGCDEMP